MKANPVFWLMWLLPGAAVCASFATLAIAMHGADTKLPASYHWEGENLDRDFQRAQHAAELGLAGTLELDAAARECVLRLRSGEASPTLRLLLTHSQNVDLDRMVMLKRSATGEFRAPCEALPEGRWRIALDDDSAGWSIRARIDGALARVDLRARDPRGPAP